MTVPYQTELRTGISAALKKAGSCSSSTVLGSNGSVRLIPTLSSQIPNSKKANKICALEGKSCGAQGMLSSTLALIL